MCFFLYFFVFFCAFSYTLLSRRLQNAGFVLLLHPLLHLLLQFVFLSLWQSIDAEHVGGEGLDACALAVLPTGDEEDTVGTSPEVPEVVEQGQLVAENVVKPRPTARGKLRGVDNRKSFPFEDFFCMSKSGQVGFPPQPTNFSAQIANLLSSHIALSFCLFVGISPSVASGGDFIPCLLSFLLLLFGIACRSRCA